MKPIRLALLVALAPAVFCEAGEDKLIPGYAKKMIPKASSISVGDLKALVESQGAPVDIKSKSLSYAILAYKPTAEPSKEAEKEFRFLGNLNITKLGKAISTSQ